MLIVEVIVNAVLLDVDTFAFYREMRKLPVRQNRNNRQFIIQELNRLSWKIERNRNSMLYSLKAMWLPYAVSQLDIPYQQLHGSEAKLL